MCYTLHGQKQNPSLKALSLNWKTQLCWVTTVTQQDLASALCCSRLCLWKAKSNV